MSGEDRDEVETHDPYFEPLVHLPPVEIKTLEEDEEDFVKLRAKLFRYISEPEPPEWKERGTGEVKILQHKDNQTCRVLMRRDKTLKICANHYVLPHMELKPNCGSDRAWVWSTSADFADEEAKAELLAIRFANVENAQKFKTAFDRAKIEMEKKIQAEISKVKSEKNKESKKDSESEEKSEEKSADEVTSQLKKLTVTEQNNEGVKDSSKEEKGQDSKGGGDVGQKTEENCTTGSNPTTQSDTSKE